MTDGRPSRDRAAPAAAGVVVVGLLAVLAVVGSVLARASGDGSYATHPIGVATLAAASGATIALAARLRDRLARRYALGAAVGLAGYAALGPPAVLAGAAPEVLGDVAAGLWSSVWSAPVTLAQLLTLRTAGMRAGWQALVAAPATAALVAAALLVPAPAAGVAPTQHAIAPPVGVWLVSLVIAPAVLVVRAARGPAAERAGAVQRAVAAVIPVLVVVCCLGTAVLQDPGDVDSGTGSVLFLVVLAVGTLAATRLATAPPAAAGARRSLLGVGAVAIGLAVLLGGTSVAGAAEAAGTSAVVVALLATVVVALGAGALLGRLAERAFPSLAGDDASRPSHQAAVALPADGRPVGAGPTRRLPALSPRESEVLALIASGRTNADIARSLVLSERTIESHVRTVYRKLGVADDGNRRASAVRLWHEAEAPAPGTR